MHDTMSSLFDEAKDAAGKAGDLAREHSDKVDTGLDKAGALVDKATSGRFTDQIDTVRDKAHEAVDRLAESEDGPPPPSDPGH